LGQVTPARVSQVMALLGLTPDLQEAILFLPRTVRGRDSIQIEDGQQLFVVYVPEGPPGLVLTEEAKVSKQLAEPYVRGQLAHLGQQCQPLSLGCRDHGRRSPILGSGPYARRSRPITSTRTRVPGASLAIRVPGLPHDK